MGPVKGYLEIRIGGILTGTTGNKLLHMFALMKEKFGPQAWWPGDTPLEIMTGAVLTQNTNWKNVEKAIENLKNSGILSLDALQKISPVNLATLIRPAGYYNIKARRLKNLIAFISIKYENDLDKFLREETNIMREGLLSVNGVGPETADSIMLYAAERPVFVIDTYTHRILSRHDIIDENIQYYELQELFMENLPEDTSLFNEFHAQIVQTGKNFCKKRPQCEECPLKGWGNI